MAAGQPTPERRIASEGRLDHRPRRVDRARLPASFGSRFAVLVDTEEEFDWNGPFRRENRSTTAIEHLPVFQHFMDQHGIEPCYLVDYPVVENAGSAKVVRTLASDGRCSIGAQLHPWVNPPDDEEVNVFNSFVGNLPVELERAKLRALTEKIIEATGVRPQIFRAGRYGIGPHTASLLEELGYDMDSSIRPHFDYSAQGGPDFRGYDVRPSWVGPGRSILSLPLSVAHIGPVRRLAPILAPERIGARPLANLLARSGLCMRIALTPEDMPSDAACRAIDGLLADGVTLFILSFHSPSLVPGFTPYVQTALDLEAFYDWWRTVLGHFRSRGVMPASLAQIRAAAGLQ